MRILVVGSGGREHALAWCLARSPNVSEVIVAPGNPGTAAEPKVRNVEIAVGDHEALVNFASESQVDLTIVGPEQPIADGIRDHFDQMGFRCFAPTARAGMLETSKSFAKEFMARHDIPTASAISTSSYSEAKQYIEEQPIPLVIKADGLAAGKGVVIAQSKEEALHTIEDMLTGKILGGAGKTVLIEQFLDGEEASFIVLCDGKTVLPFSSSQDHKPIFDGDKGPNTGGMGAYSPAPVVTDDIHQKVLDRIVHPTIAGMSMEGNTYQGFLYFGLMIVDNEPYVIEYNCRFGDPEAQPVLMRLTSNLAELCLKAITVGGLESESLEFTENSALAVVLASAGYPGSYQTGIPISGIEAEQPNTKVFHAGTAEGSESIVTNGGRVLTVVGLGPDIESAQHRAYTRAESIHWEGCSKRTDIGNRAIGRTG